MSKSVGNVIAPQDVIKQSGADILRLWVGDERLHRKRSRVSKEILARVVEAYRKMRNTLRYLVANLYDFDPARDALTVDADGGGRSVHPGAIRRRRAADPEARTRSTTTARSSRRSTRSSTVDLSAFYATSRRIACTRSLRARGSGARRRRRCIVMADGLARLLAPILSFTADELWRHLPGDTRRVGAPRAVSRQRPSSIA